MVHVQSMGRRYALSLILGLAIFVVVPLVAAEEGPDREMLIAAAFESIPDAGDTSCSPYFFVMSDDPSTEQLPLRGSFATVDVTGVIAQVSLEQVYENTGDTTIEAVYIFPASTKAAVHGMKMTVGKRTIVAKIQESAKARETYEEALEQGKTASLLEQRKPNVFQMSVGNILPGDRVSVELEYTELISPEDGTYEFVLPTVVGPRYAGADSESDWAANPYLTEGETAPYDFEVDVHLISSIPIARVSSPSHEIDVDFESKLEANAGVQGADAANRDFVLRYNLRGEAIDAGLIIHEGKGGKYFLAMVEPPERTVREQTVRREYLFVVDVSGSMNGFPLDVSKELIRKMIRGLDDRERFNVLLFAGGSDVLSEKSLPATAKNLSKALRWLDSANGGGGTELLPALRRAFALPRSEGFSRTVVVATDGYVTIDDEAYELVSRKLGEGNLFAFGIGTSVNRNIVEGMARAGMGEAFVVESAGAARKEAKRFREYVSTPLLTDISVKTKGLDVQEIIPRSPPDLFASRPLIVYGEFKGAPAGEIVFSGKTAAGSWSKTLKVKDASQDTSPALQYLFARKKIAALRDKDMISYGKRFKDEITKLGLAHNLLTDYTSFVAVDTVVRADGKKSKIVRQPLPLPEGVSNSAVENALGALVGNQVGNNFGYGGMGLAGTGRGGSGVGKGSIGLGSINTTGHGGGGGSGSGYGRGAGRLAGKRAKAGPAIRVAAVEVKGSLSKEVVRRVIRRQTAQFKRCYEKALESNPELEGKVMIKLVINADGKVLSASVAESTLDDTDMEHELAQIMKKMTFPAVAGGGVVIVYYPLIFKPGQ